MIFAVTKPINEYNSGEVGLEISYRHNPRLLALILIGTPTGYYHEGSIPIKDRPAKITDEGTIYALEQTLEVMLEGKTISDHLANLNPIEFASLLERHPVIRGELPLVKAVFSDDALLFLATVKARSAAWARNYRGPVVSEGKLTTIAFNGLEVDEASELWDKELEGRFAHR